MVSRVLGYVRDFFIARVFGAGLLTDAFFVAFKIPNLLRRLFAEGAFSQAFVPILAEHKNREPPEARDADRPRRHAAVPRAGARRRARHGGGAAHRLPHRAGLRRRARQVRAHGGAAAHHLSRTSSSSRWWRSPAGILNTWSRFAVPAITPVLLNVSFIVGAVFFAERFDPPVHGARLGGVHRRRCCSSRCRSRFSRRLGLLPRWRLDLQHPGVRRVLMLMAPAAFGVSVSQVSLLINQIFASFLRHRQRVLALLRRPADGVPGGRARRGARHDPAAQPVEAPCRRRNPRNTAGCSTGDCA